MSADLFEDSFDLIAFHSDLEDYAMAYTLNLCLKSDFKRRKEDLDISEHVKVPIFEWKDDINGRYWTFFTNTGLVEETLVRSDLFENEPSFTKLYMVPEYRDVDYFLKIDQDGCYEIEDIIKALLSIPKIITAYSIDTDKLKSKSNLIF